MSLYLSLKNLIFKYSINCLTLLIYNWYCDWIEHPSEETPAFDPLKQSCAIRLAFLKGIMVSFEGPFLSKASFATATCLVLSAFFLGLLLKLRRTFSKPAPKSIPSPRRTLLPHLSNQEASRLPYPPDLLPGARDVDTPYGSLRAYEWGPEDAQHKVVMVPGDTTPAPIFGHLANLLVQKGVRVLLMGESE